MLGFRRDSALISFYVVWTVSTRGVTVPNVVVGPALFYGGLAQLLAGSEYQFPFFAPRSRFSLSILGANDTDDLALRSVGVCRRVSFENCSERNDRLLTISTSSLFRVFSNTFGATAFCEFICRLFRRGRLYETRNDLVCIFGTRKLTFLFLF